MYVNVSLSQFIRIFAHRNNANTTMNNSFLKRICALFFLLLVIMSCSYSNENFLDRIEQIKEFGNEDPEKALAMLDSLEIEVRNESNYAKHKYDLLRIRLNDKAYNFPYSDIMIKKLIGYFEEKGSFPEKQEVYFYAGSTYRDLRDTPRALECFFKSLDYALGNNECDLIMIRNTYSNLNFLYYRVQDYKNALKAGLDELGKCRKTQSDDMVAYQHVGAAYLALDSAQQALAAFDSVYACIIQSGDYSKYQESLIFLLYDYSYFHNMEKAKACKELIEYNPLEAFSGIACMAFAWYYEALGKNDSATIYYNRILDDGRDTVYMYDAAKHLFSIYSNAGDEHKAALYAKNYMELSSAMDFGKRQELAATINNQYQYHLDQKKERDLKEEKERYKNTLIIVSLTALLLSSIGYILYIWRRNRHLQIIAGLSSELQHVSEKEKQLSESVKKKEKDLAKAKKSLDNSTDELNNVKQELLRVNNELTKQNEELKEKEQQLTEKMEQNKTFIKLLHQSELEGKAEDVIHDIRMSSTGRKNMGSADWKQLYQAVDELYPTFKDRLLKELGTFTEQQMQVCYLMRIGLSKPQIQNMTNLARVTIWRWVKKYDWVFVSEE